MSAVRRSRPALVGSLAVVLAGAVTGGCAVMGGGASVRDIYTLSAPQAFGASLGKTRAQILIPVPRAVAALNTDNIAVVSGATKISYFADASWSDRVPKLFQAKVVEAFENTGRVHAVGLPGEGLLIDYQLATDIRAFQLDVNGARVAMVEFSAKIINDRNGRVVAAQTFQAQAPAASDTADAAVTAMNRALETALGDLISWTLSRI